MTNRRPLVLVNGRIVELPLNDTTVVGQPGESYVAAEAISGHVAVVIDGDGKVTPADTYNAAHAAVAGLTTGAVEEGAVVFIVSRGSMFHGGWTFAVGLPVFVGAGGTLVQTPPPGAVFTKVIGMATSPTRISIDFQPAIFTS